MHLHFHVRWAGKTNKDVTQSARVAILSELKMSEIISTAAAKISLITTKRLQQTHLSTAHPYSAVMGTSTTVHTTNARRVTVGQLLICHSAMNSDDIE